MGKLKKRLLVEEKTNWSSGCRMIGSYIFFLLGRLEVVSKTVDVVFMFKLEWHNQKWARPPAIHVVAVSEAAVRTRHSRNG